MSDMLARLRRKRVLFLDDDPSMQRLVSALLKRGGYRVDTFLTGREAIAALERDGYEVLLLDVMMPHEGGSTVIRHLLKNNPRCSIARFSSQRRRRRCWDRSRSRSPAW